MRVSEAIIKADELRPNALSPQQKASWLYELEGEVADMMRVATPENLYPEQDPELLMPYPHDNIYVYYLCAQIDNGQQDTVLYQNDAEVSNEAIAQAFAWWRRHHRPPVSGIVRVM